MPDRAHPDPTVEALDAWHQMAEMHIGSFRDDMAKMIEAAKVRSEVTPRFDLIKHLYRQCAFSLRVFGPDRTPQSAIDHIRKELVEIEKNPTDLTEWVDVVLLALDGAWRRGYSPEEIAAAISAKLAQNETRQWPDWRDVAPDDAIEHVRGEESQHVG